MKAAPLIAALIVAACAPQRPEPAARELTRTQPAPADLQPPRAALPRSAPHGIPVADVTAILGEWRVAGIDDVALAQPVGIAVSIHRDHLRAVSGCVFFDWSLALARGAITMIRRPSPTPPCARPLTRDETRFAAAMSKVTKASRLENQALFLAGPGGDVSLFTQ